MDFIPKQHLDIGNYIKYVDEILHKCDKGIEYCKICPNEFVCSELEKDDFGLANSTISDVLTAVQYALSRVPGYLNNNKRADLREHIKRYIAESPIHERAMWEDSILNISLDNKLANPSFKPMANIGDVRLLLAYDNRIGFSACLRCLCFKNEDLLPENKTILHHETTSNSINAVNQFVRSKHTNLRDSYTPAHIKHYLEKGMAGIIQRCNTDDMGLATALSYYAVLTRSPVPVNIAVTGGLDIHGRTLQTGYLDSKIEAVLRELHFIEKIVITRGSLFSNAVPNYINIIEVGNIEEAADIVFNN